MTSKRKQNGSLKTEWLKKQIKNHQISHLKKTISIQENRNFWKEQQNEN